jgi:hypothetical protein
MDGVFEHIVYKVRIRFDEVVKSLEDL